MSYVLSLFVGLAVGAAYGLLGVRSPAPPVIAPLGLLGMLAGEALVSYPRGRPDVLGVMCHRKSFAVEREPPAGDGAPPPAAGLVAASQADRRQARAAAARPPPTSGDAHRG